MSVIRNGSVQVFTFKDGLLSRLGHDLRFRVTRFEVQVEERKVSARFRSDSLELEGAMVGTQLQPDVLGARDRRDIEETAREKILQIRRFPEVRFEGELDLSTAERPRATGTLELVGQRQPLAIELERGGGRVRGKVVLTPSRFGIAPYKALLGALKLQDRVELVFDLEDDATA